MSSPAFEQQKPSILRAPMDPETIAKEAGFQLVRRAMYDRIDEAETQRRVVAEREGERIRLRLSGQQTLFGTEELSIPETP